MAIDDGLDLGQEVGSDQAVGFIENQVSGAVYVRKSIWLACVRPGLM